MAEKIKFTKAKVDKLPLAEEGRIDYFDASLKGFGVRASRTKKVYFVLRRVGGKLSRVTIGPTNTLSADQARREAETIIVKMNQGEDVNEEKRKARLRGRSLDDVLQDYLLVRELKPNTILTYQKLMNFHLGDWLRLPLAEITPEMVADRHKKIAKNSGKAPANNAMRTMRAIYNHGLAVCNDLPSNPVERLTLSRQWFRVERRKTTVSQNDLAAWFKAVNEYPNSLVQEYLRLILFTGLRREEAATIRWENVDMSAKIFTLVDTKNRKDHVLPMSDFVFGIFQRRLAERENDFVFPGRGKAGHFRDPRKAIEKIVQASGVKFCNHDLRRTFTTVTEGHVSYSTLKRLLNHSGQNDVTQGYISHGVEDLRKPMQQVTDVLLRLCHAS